MKNQFDESLKVKVRGGSSHASDPMFVTYFRKVDECIDVKEDITDLNLSFQLQHDDQCGMHVVNNIGQLHPFITIAEMRNIELRYERAVCDSGNYTSTTVKAAFADRGFVIEDIPLTVETVVENVIKEVLHIWNIEACVGLYVESVLLNHYHGVIKGPANLPILMDSIRGCPVVLHDFTKYLRVTLDQHTSIGMIMKDELYSLPIIQVSVCMYIYHVISIMLSKLTILASLSKISKYQKLSFHWITQ